ncbi:putative uncharacterized protein [Ruminococcus sp. CAG:90]|nr:putative uncharacterized protein [Ruminococcus sp. CAG:90]
MEELKNICGRIPLDLHERVRQEIEDTESSIPKFLQMVIEEHFTRKGEIGMDAKKTIAVQVTEELFNRFKKVVEWKKCKQKDFLIDLLEQAIEEAEQKMREESNETEPAEEDPEEPQDSEATE